MNCGNFEKHGIENTKYGLELKELKMEYEELEELTQTWKFIYLT